jgi:hypothetical protein
MPLLEAMLSETTVGNVSNSKTCIYDVGQQTQASAAAAASAAASKDEHTEPPEVRPAEPGATGIRGLKLLLYEALSY